MNRQQDATDHHVLSTQTYRGAIFDLDGVITETASLHFASWKEAFDDLLRSRDGADFRPFTEEDYREYVDGKPRHEGLESFLTSRGVDLPHGDEDDPPGRETVYGIARAKNQRYQQMLASGDIHVYRPAVELIRSLHDHGVPVAVVSSSRNTKYVLEHAGLASLFDARVDGLTLSERDDLRGKPAPDMFVEAARLLGVSPQEAVVFEDAEAGVEAGRAGEFRLVVGVARSEEAKESLAEHGADVVVDTLGAFEVG